jgi:predicted ATPase
MAALQAAQCLVRDPGGGPWTLARSPQLSAAALNLPDSIHGVVLSRIDRLPESHKLTLKVASVIGTTFEIEVLRRCHPVLLDEDALLAQVGLLEAREFTRLELPPPRLACMFKHSTTHEVAYQTLLEAQQRELHRAAGGVLEAEHPEEVERLAYHYRRSGVREKAVFYLDRAAARALREYANETALSYYGAALAYEERWQ